MGNYCSRSESDDSVIKPKFLISKDYQEIEGQFSGEGVKKTISWKATITRLQLEAKREEFWNTRTTGRRIIWLVIKNAIDNDHETAALLLQMSDIVLKSGNITVLEDTYGNTYEIPPFIINCPMEFANEKKKVVTKKEIENNVSIHFKIRKAGAHGDSSFEVNNLVTGMELKQMYVNKENVPIESLRLFFGGKELNYSNNLAVNCVQSDMVIHAFIIKLSEPLD